MAQIPANPSVDVEGLKPFKKFIMTIGNIPTSYLESLSYAELVMWFCNYLQETVIPTVNNNGGAVEELQGLYIELKNYVDNYFTDLDVQEEINNKLDEMAEDGSLTNLISVYIDPLIDEQNDRIDIIDRKVDGATSGSPLVASSVEQMTDTSRIYVNTTDGHWYWYDGTSWQDGGVYQSSGISDGSIIFSNLSENIQDSFDSNNETTNIIGQNNKFIDYTLIPVSANRFYAFIADVNPFESYKLNLANDLSQYSDSADIITITDENNNRIKKLTKNDVIAENNRINIIIDIPYNGKKLYVNTFGGYSYILKINKFIPTDIKKEQLDEKLQSIFTEEYEEVSPTLLLNNGYMDGSFYLNSLSGYRLYKLEVNPKEKYTITVKQIYGNPTVIFTTNNLNRPLTLNDVSYNLKAPLGVIKSDESEHQYTDYEFTIPEYCKEIYINVNTNHQLVIKKNTNYKVQIDDTDVEEVKNSLNPLNNKKLIFAGDSICEASTPGVKGWVQIMQENNPNASFYNFAVGGATIADNGTNNNVYHFIQNMYATHPDADYVILQGGVNDIWQNIPLGEFTPNTNFNNNPVYDTTTFSGALEWIFRYCYTNFPGKKLGFIITQKIFNSGSFWDYMERAREICNKWSIPFVDLYNDGNLNYYMASQRSAYSITTVMPNGDGCHPNLAGYEILTPKIENWIKYVL